MRQHTSRFAVTAAGLLLACSSFATSALAQTGGGESNGGGGTDQGDGRLRYDVNYNNDEMIVKDRTSGQTLLQQPKRFFALSRIDGALVPEIQVVMASNGYDLHYTFTNTSSSPKPLPDLRVGPLFLGNDIQYQDFRRSCEAVETNPDIHRNPGHNYPVNMYSPTWVTRNGDHASGVSLQYPILDYHHDAKFYLKYHERSGGWLVEIRLSSDNGALEYSAEVPAGQTWDYTVNVRFDPRSEEWVRTLLPYRDYFRAKYGGLQYDRQTGPMNAMGLSMMYALSEDNPYGFHRDDMRPDQLGYGPLIDFVLQRRGWPTQMIVTPTGHYRRNVEKNYPFRFTSQWLSSPELETALDPDVGFPRIHQQGKELAFWWGRSGEVAFEWDPNVSYELDPDNRSHRDAAFAELDLAVQAGASIIGMDTFGHRAVPIWKGYQWIDMLKARHPQLKFAVEPMPCDIMHTKAAGWLRGFNDENPVDTIEELSFIKGPHYLADFLLPGHETWAAWRYKGHREYFNLPVNELMMNHDLARFANWGYRPLFYVDLDLNLPDIAAKESWLFTVPEDIQIAANNDSSYGPEFDDGDGGSAGPLAQGDSGSSNGARGGSGSRGSGSKVGSSRNSAAKAQLIGVTREEARQALERARRHLRPGSDR